MDTQIRLNSDGTKEFDPCGRCGGKGYIAGFEFSDNARCWECHTTGGVWLTRGTLERRARRRASAAKLRAKKAAAKAAAEEATRETAWTAWVAENRDVLDFVEAAHLGELGTFMFDMKDRLQDRRPLTERQTAAVRRIAEKAATEATSSSPVPVTEARIVVTGEVISVKEQFNAYGSTIKMLVRDDQGFKVWGTMPSSIMGEQCTGKRVTFTARVTPSDNDETFGFFSRPTKAELV